MMRKRLRSLLDLLREKPVAAFREKTSVRRDAEGPQYLQAVPKRVHGHW